MSKAGLTQHDLIFFLRDDLNIDALIDNDTELFSSGLLDSVSMVNLISFVEKNARVTVQTDAVTLENFDSVNRIVDYVRGLG